jgi:SAM-dependent methyltransferase
VEEAVYQQLYAVEDHHWWFRGRRAVIRALLGRAGLVPAPRILDAGCGTGRNMVELSRLGRVEGVDPSPHAIEFCRRRGLGGVTESELEALPFEDGAFDLILASDVIEHIEDDRAALAELRRVAAPRGRLLVTVPAYQWMWSRFDDEHHHFRRYTVGRLRASMAAAGWAPVVTTHFNALLLAPIAAARMLARVGVGDGGAGYELPPPWANRILGAPMRAEARLIAAGGRLPAGVSIGMVCAPAR